MPWVPIEESPFYSDWSIDTWGSAVINGSTITALGDTEGWGIFYMHPDTRIRASFSSYTSAGDGLPPFFSVDAEEVHSSITDGFQPNPVELPPSSYIQFYTNYSLDDLEYLPADYEIFLEVWEGDDPDPDPGPDPDALVANDDEATTNANTPVTVDVLANDTLGDEPVTLSDLDGPPTIETQPQNGTVAVNADGTITYTPNPGFTGTDTFEYRITTPEPEPSCPEIWSSNGGFEMAELWSQIPAFGEFGGNGFYLINGSVGIAFWSSDGEYAYPDVGEDYPDCGHLGEWIMSWGEGTGEQCVIWENGCS